MDRNHSQALHGFEHKFEYMSEYMSECVFGIDRH